MNTLKEKFLAICRQHIKRPGLEDLLAWLEKYDFFTAPASTKYHGAYPGGLLQHSLNVYAEIHRIKSAYPSIKIPEESLAIVSLLHDLCKVNFYATETRNRKNTEGQWESYEYYTVNERFNYGGHGSKSVYLIQNFMKLTPEEAVAINCHMGAFDNDQYIGKSFEQFPLAWFLHAADCSAAFIVEPKQDAPEI